MKTFICTQAIVVSEESHGYSNNIVIGNIVRKVFANNVNEAIGKFVLNTASVVCKQRLNIDCNDINEILTVN